MNLAWKWSAAWALFMSLQLVSSTPFFGVSVQGGFQVEADIAASAKAVAAVFESSQQSMTTFSTKLTLSTVALNTTAGGVLQLYSIFESNVGGFATQIARAAVNATDSTTEVFKKLTDVYNSAVTALGQDATAAIALISAYSTANGAQLATVLDSVKTILNDINTMLGTFQRTIDTLSSPITMKKVFDSLTKSQIASIVGALDALKTEVTVVTGKLQDTATTLTDSDSLMSTYVSQLSQAFSNVDSSLANVFTSLTRISVDFRKQFQSSDVTVTDEVAAFNAKINSFSDNQIASVASKIKAITNSLSQTYSQTYTILKPNVEERLELVIGSAADTVLAAAQNILFTVYRVLDNAMRRYPSVPTKGKSCSTEHISPYVQYLSSNLASLLNGCISSTVGQAESVLRKQIQSIEALVKDRLAYVKMWNEVISGLSTTSEVVKRSVAAAKLIVTTTDQNGDVLQPALASSFSMYAQLVSNLDAVLNRVKLCVTVKSAELSAQLVTTSTNFNTCING